MIPLTSFLWPALALSVYEPLIKPKRWYYAVIIIFI